MPTSIGHRPPDVNGHLSVAVVALALSLAFICYSRNTGDSSARV